MKKVLIALIVLGISGFSAEAKTKTKKAAADNNPNYRVCLDNGTYYTCGKEGDGAPVSMGKTKVAKINSMDRKAWSVPCDDPSVALNVNHISSYQGYYRKHNIIVSDDMHNPYEGKVSQQNDGPAENDYRNLNYNQTSIYLPPNSGSYVK